MSERTDQDRIAELEEALAEAEDASVANRLALDNALAEIQRWRALCSDFPVSIDFDNRLPSSIKISMRPVKIERAPDDPVKLDVILDFDDGVNALCPFHGEPSECLCKLPALSPEQEIRAWRDWAATSCKSVEEHEAERGLERAADPVHSAIFGATLADIVKRIDDVIDHALERPLMHAPALTLFDAIVRQALFDRGLVLGVSVHQHAIESQVVKSLTGLYIGPLAPPSSLEDLWGKGVYTDPRSKRYADLIEIYREIVASVRRAQDEANSATSVAPIRSEGGAQP